MEEKALLMAEKVRIHRWERCLRAAGVRSNNYFAADDQTLSSKLKSKLQDLKTTVAYFIQVEDVLFSWILTAGKKIFIFCILVSHSVLNFTGFRMSTAYRVSTGLNSG